MNFLQRFSNLYNLLSIQLLSVLGLQGNKEFSFYYNFIAISFLYFVDYNTLKIIRITLVKDLQFTQVILLSRLLSYRIYLEYMEAYAIVEYAILKQIL